MVYEFLLDDRKTNSRLVVICLASILLNVVAFAEQQTPLDKVRTLRLQGKLPEAKSLAEQQVERNFDHRHVAISFHLELARIHDRIGLHHNSRPVAGALEHIDAAASLAERTDAAALAEIELARADYFYRAEMSARDFPRAAKYAQGAKVRFQEIEDQHGEADAVHRLGLIQMQRGDLQEARNLFEQSKTLDKTAGERTFFRGEYERHVGFVYLLNGDVAAAIPYFERSLVARIEAGAIDASLFAAASLASALVDAGRITEAKPHILYAMNVAEQIESPAGKARAAVTLGQIYEYEGDLNAARATFEMALRNAEDVAYAGIVEQMKAALQRLELLTVQ
jgi:tetratricopeptide (TPR) repeat protein